MDVEGSRAHTQAAMCALSVSVLRDLFSGTSICNRLTLIGLLFLTSGGFVMIRIICHAIYLVCFYVPGLWELKARCFKHTFIYFFKVFRSMNPPFPFCVNTNLLK